MPLQIKSFTQANTYHTRALILCGLFTALIAVGAFIQIPVPYLDYFTLQFFFVLLAGLILGPKMGFLSVCVYLMLGLFGVPIFAAGGGFSYVLRPSFGYLIGFAAASFLCGFTAKKIKAATFPALLFSCFIGMIAVYGIGLSYKYLILTFYMQTPTPFWVLFLSCFPLDIPGDIFLCFCAAALSKRLLPVISR